MLSHTSAFSDPDAQLYHTVFFRPMRKMRTYARLTLHVSFKAKQTDTNKQFKRTDRNTLTSHLP